MKSIFLLRVFLCCITGIWAADSPSPSPWGADAVPDLYAPNLAGPGAFTTSTGGAPASAINPAQGGEAQRIVFDVGYLGLAGLGDERGYGHAMELGTLIPTRYAVFGGSLRYIHSPFVNFPVQRVFSGNLNAAKEIYPRMSIGAGLNFGFGDEWSLNGDLGFRWNSGRLGPLKNFTWAAVLRGMGKSWTPSWFTPMVGVSFDLLHIEGRGDKRDPLLLNVSADLSFPSLAYFPDTSLIFKLGLRAELFELLRFSLSWPGASGLNARELYKGGDFPILPSVGIGTNITLPSKGRRIAGGRLPSDGDLAVDLAYKPLYGGVTAIGAGATWTVGIADSKPPLITLDYPEDEALYFSPTNSGKADYLEFPISITDSRYVDNWTWEIRDEEGNVVRTYRNKELRPETHGFKDFFSRLTAVKKQVEVPQTLRWDGIGDSGELAPDGRYFFTVSAADDSGNAITSAVYEAVLDTTPPEISIEPMDDPQRVFSPGGGGSKNTISFSPQGSPEDSWESGIYNTAGDRIRSFEAESGKPGQRVWDGKDDSGAIVPDGVYTYKIEATDRALNYGSAVMSNIVVNTIRPVIRIIIADPWLSPNNDGVKDTVGMNLTVPIKEEVTAWTVQIRERSGTVRRTIQGGRTTAIPDRLDYDGRNDAGAVLTEGEYYAELSVNYLNGFTATALSPSFNLKTTPPMARIAMDFAAFSPNHGGVQSEMIIRQEGSREQLWTGEIRRKNGIPGEPAVRSFRFSGSPPPVQHWDGHGESGTFAADGEYTYQLFATDQAGNTGRSNVLDFRLSSVDTPVMITTDLRAFSPGGNSPKTTINFTPHVQVRTGVVNYKLDVLDSRGSAVRSFEGQGVPPATINWNGRTTANATAPEGIYTAKLQLRYEQGNQPDATSLPFELDVTPPKAAVSAPYTIFSPSGRGTIPFSVTTEANDEWKAAIVGANGRVIKTWNWKGPAPQVSWDGRDDAGNVAPDGTYQFTLESTDAAGNTGKYSISGLTLDARIPRLILTASETGIAPKANQTSEMVRFGVMCSLQEGIANWSLELKDERGSTLKRFGSQPAASPGSPVAPPPATIGWNGLSENGIREGRFTPVMTVNYIKGDVVRAEAAPILVHVSGPELSLSVRPTYFSPDNDGVEDELFISLGAKSVAPIASWYLEIREPVAPYLLFYRIEGKGSPAEQVIWDGRSNKGELVQSATDYPVKFSATDILGNSSVIESQIGVDVLVIRDGDRLRILVPSIVFRENAADFNGIPADRVDNNLRVLRRIADILNKFRDYKVLVEGHANPVLLTDREERNELQPLSEARARMVMNMLVEFGVTRTRISSVGMGGTRPVIRYMDRDNWWKNRRVEFILIK